MKSNPPDQHKNYIETKSTGNSTIMIGADLCQEVSETIGIETQSAEAVLEEPVIQSEPVEKSEQVELTGFVTGCRNLNVREAPDPGAAILAVIPVGSEVMADPDASTNEFYKICNAAGVQGFCMKQFIMLRK